jgi:hypothetical protein
MRGKDLRDAFLPAPEMALEVGTDELVLAPERVVEGGLGDAGPLDNPVNSDHMNAFRVEQLVCGG